MASSTLHYPTIQWRSVENRRKLPGIFGKNVSAGLRSLLVAAKQLKAKKGDLGIAGLEGPVKDVFKISGFYSLFKIIENEPKP